MKIQNRLMYEPAHAGNQLTVVANFGNFPSNLKIKAVELLPPFAGCITTRFLFHACPQVLPPWTGMMLSIITD